jgi:hypothetical protein
MMGQRLRSWCLLIGALGVCILFAATTGRADVVVDRHQLVSSNPGLRVIVTPGFRYIGEAQFTTQSRHADVEFGATDQEIVHLELFALLGLTGFR